MEQNFAYQNLIDIAWWIKDTRKETKWNLVNSKLKKAE